MKHVYRTIVVAALFLILASRGPVAGQELTSSQEAVSKAEAQRHVERYYNYYYERNPEALSTEIFTLPWMTLGGKRKSGSRRPRKRIWRGSSRRSQD